MTTRSRPLRCSPTTPSALVSSSNLGGSNKVRARSALSGIEALPFSGTLERVDNGCQPHSIGLRQPPFQRHAPMIFADDCHGFAVVQLPLGIGLGIGVVAIERDEL